MCVVAHTCMIAADVTCEAEPAVHIPPRTAGHPELCELHLKISSTSPGHSTWLAGFYGSLLVVSRVLYEYQ